MLLFSNWFNFGTQNNSELPLIIEILQNALGIIIFLLALAITLFIIFLPLIIVIFLYKKSKKLHTENKTNKETELQLLREQNELLKSLVDSNKGED